ncbi:MAG TPA: tetratricopeptide repeat protein [Candidatus Acidoferrum sp.]|nr:tetratricopeptide repeat protein [Candidatus Acidoferrum sp.]
MAYSKSKYVEAAQKLLNQGKVPQAIAEYQQILKYEPKDQVTLMTIGELYIRQGETFQAIDYFERLAQIFVGDGFLTKAIAVYKRIAKLAPEEIRPLEKLADLYVQQGVMSEARPLFLQLAEIHLKNNKQPEAVALLKKLLLAEPDNLRIQIRLADLYTAMGQTADAIEAYVSAAQRALARGDSGECEKLADRALKLDPKNMAAVIVKARIHSSKGDVTSAAKALEQVADLDKGGEQTELLLDMYLKNSDWEHAAELALKVFNADPKNFGPAHKITEALLQADQGEQAMELLARIRIPMVDAGEHEPVGRLLSDLAARLPGHIEPLEWLVEFYGRTSDSFRLADALAHLGDALASRKKYDRAKEVFEQLVASQPDSDAPKRKLNEVLRKLGHDVTEEAPEPVHQEEENSPVELAKPKSARLPSEAEAPEVRAKPAEGAAETPLDDETQKFIDQSLTDVDLFASYGLTQKAIGLLEAILRRAPQHAPTLEKLLDFVLGAGDDRRTAELAAQLEKIHTSRGDVHSAERFEELRRRFQRAAGLTDEELAGEQPAAAEPAPPPPEPAVEKVASAEGDAPTPQEVHEVDLSDEWASMLSDARPAETAAKAPAAGEDAAPEFEVPMEAAVHENTNPFAESSTEAPAVEDLPEISIRREAHETASIFERQEAIDEPFMRESPAPAGSSAQNPPAKEKPKAKDPEPEFEVEQDYELVLDAEPLVPAHAQEPPTRTPEPRRPEPVHQNSAAPAATDGNFASDQFLADLANEIDQLGLGGPPPGPAPPQKRGQAPAQGNKSKPAATPPPPSGNVESGPLKEVFDDFRAELGEMGAEEEDLETHYNLGIAFREMGLLEEAISEFQKVAKATDRGRAFRYTMQCCTLLGLAFMEKGQPGVAAIWYDRALHTPDLDPESALALRYDLGVAQESAGEPVAALKSFSQVYAMNIDYRDVGERIAALQKPIR